MRADFHIHTQVSPDSFLSPKALVRACQRAGMDVIAVTDHHTIRGALAVQEVAPFRVIIGAEFRTADGEIIGLFLEEDVPRGLSARETVRRIKDQGGIVQMGFDPNELRFFMGYSGWGSEQLEDELKKFSQATAIFYFYHDQRQTDFPKKDAQLRLTRSSSGGNR